ncbi:DUF4124 domain-containing protein [Dyella psychrodurans]|uniref:DUF4124 domain-containing protein n=2 Tax=Dyella psychrodurans TaxID=1927960 RepID=A0A370X4H7_9GAMM|nr:DUF4124 domain-containing protein [Dyella psychrodurans]
MLLVYVLLFAWANVPAPAVADTTTVYKCVAANGSVIYQGTPCAHGQREQTMQLQDDGPVSSPLPTPVDDTPRMATTPPPAPAKPPSMPPAPMYRCIRATDNKPYVSSNGNPQPYYAPLAMTGIVPTPIGQNYGGRVSPNAAMIASHYTLMQDTCQPMTPQDTCTTLRDEYDENEKKLSRTFKSDQPPLLQRESELLAQLQQC